MQKSDSKVETPEPKPYTAESFTQTLLRLKDSPTYGKYCEQVHVRNLYQFNAVDEEQLQKLISL